MQTIFVMKEIWKFTDESQIHKEHFLHNPKRNVNMRGEKKIVQEIRGTHDLPAFHSFIDRKSLAVKINFGSQYNSMKNLWSLTLRSRLTFVSKKIKARKLTENISDGFERAITCFYAWKSVILFTNWNVWKICVWREYFRKIILITYVKFEKTKNRNHFSNIFGANSIKQNYADSLAITNFPIQFSLFEAKGF